LILTAESRMTYFYLAQWLLILMCMTSSEQDKGKCSRLKFNLSKYIDFTKIPRPTVKSISRSVLRYSCLWWL